MKIVVIGAGYVGLVSGVCFADFGHHVTCVDINKEKIKQLNNGIIPIYEPGLDALLAKNLDGQRIFFSDNVEQSLQEASVVFIAVGTPERRGGGEADLAYVMDAAKDIAKFSKNNILVVTKSTVPLGTNRKVKEIIAKANPHLDFDIASNPEFLREGSAIEDFQKPDRVIVGITSDRAKKTIQDIYKPLFLRDFPIMFTSLESAETIKYASNAFLATKISFINEIAELCEKAGANIQDVSKGMGLDNRIGDKFLHAGPGYGGSCFPKDTSALVETGKNFNVDLSIIKSVIKTNHDVKLRMVDKVVNAANGNLKGSIISVLGVTFKPNTDDMREAPSLIIIPELIKRGAKIRVTDPQGEREGSKLLKNVEWDGDIYNAASGSDMLLILTEWNEFRALDLEKLSKIMTSPVMVDLRNIYNKDQVLSSGFISYDSVGR
ncbi:UDP-glucose/GDP-mannose dehydrogenase family protein [Gammaproteobacteria bacterium]|jgi:UDPglucose 6-dehydrogenase|nr:UDP-glucose/GDP-mannose dehydrogenase family protein [Gammaproteobacteria bacterium]